MMEDVKSIMISTMSHELRTPLIGVVGAFVELLMQQLPSSIIDKICIANGCSLILLNIINCMLDFSQLELNKFKLHIEEFELSALLDELHHIFYIMA